MDTYGRECFDFSDHFLRMCFPKQGSNIISGEGGVTGGVRGGKTGGKSITKVLNYNTLTSKQIEVLQLLLIDEKVTYEEMASKLGVKSTTSVQKHINGLKKAGSVSRDQDYGGKWLIHFAND